MKYYNLYLAKLAPNSPERAKILEKVNACVNGLTLEHKHLISEVISKTEFQKDNFHRAYNAEDLNGALVIKPDMFKKIIVLDPVLFSKRKRYVIWLLRKLGFTDWLGVTKKAKKRRTHFSDLEEVRKIYQQKALFKDFHPKCFEDYLKHGFIRSENGVELAFSKDVEADVFRYIQIKVPANLDKLDGVLIYGNTSDTFWKSDMKWWKRNFPNFEIIPFDGGHLFPFEKPEETAKLLNKYISMN